MKKFLSIFTVFSLLMVIFTGCDNFMNSNDDFKNLMGTEIDYAKAPLVNILVGHNNDDFGTVGTGVVNYSLTAKVGYAFEVNFALKSTAGNFVGWTAYTKYDPDIPSNCVLLDDSYIEFVDNSRGKVNAKVKILKKIDEQIRLVPEVSAFPVMEVCLPSELLGITPAPVSFNPPQPVKTLTPGQEYSITATTTVDYGYSDNPDECWKVYRKDTLGNEIEIVNGDYIIISKNPGTQLANGRSQSTIYITVDPEFSGRFYVSPKLITYPSMKVEVENFDTSLVRISHSGTVSMAKDTPYEISLQTDPTVGFQGWKLCKRNNITLEEIEEIFPADNRTTTNFSSFTTYSDEYITVASPTYEVAETGKTSGKVNASIFVTLTEDMDDLDYSYYLLPQFFKYPVVNILNPDGYASAGRFSLIGASYLENDSVRMMMDDYEYTLTYKTTEDYSFAEPYWIIYETSNPEQNLLEANDSRIEILKSSVITDEADSSSCSVSVILKHNFGSTLNIKPVVAQKPRMNISFASGTPSGINLSVGWNTITSGSVNSKSIKMATGKTYTATVNVPKGYSFEGWRLVRESTSNNKSNWITESTKTTTDIIDNATLEFDSESLSENPADFIRLFNAKYSFELEGRNAGTTKATIDISFIKELTDFSLNLIPVIKAVPEISFVSVSSDYGTLSPSTSDVRNLYLESKINLSFKSTKQATAGKEIWRIKKWDSATGAYSIDYTPNVGYTSLDLTAALKDPVLSEKEIIIYSNDNEAEVQPNSKGEYITTKNAVLYVNKMPDANLQVSVTPEIYNTIKFVPGTQFESSVYDNPVIIPAGKTFDFTINTKAGNEFKSIETPEKNTNTTITVKTISTDFNGISTVTGTILSTKNNGDAVVVTPSATEINKIFFNIPVLSSNLNVGEEDSGTITPPAGDFIYQVVGNSCSVKFETSGEYTYEGFSAGNIRFKNVSVDSDEAALYVLSNGTLAQAKAKAPNAKIVIHDIVETEFEDNLGQTKKKVSGTISVVIPGETVTVRPVVTPKPSMNISFAEGTPNGINFSLGLNTITSGSVNNKSIIMTTGKTYTATVNVPKGYSFEGWRLVRETVNNRLNWISESVASTTEIVENVDLTFDENVNSEKPADYIRLFNAKYSFELEGRNAGTTKATVDISFKKELTDFSLYLIPIIKTVPEISFVPVNSDYGILSPSVSDVRNLYPETKIDLSFKSTKQATAGKEIWRIRKWDSSTGAYTIDYTENVGYTSLDLTAALKDPVLSEKEIIIYNNDNEVEVQPNSKGEYITTKSAVLYVNKMPEENLQVSIVPEVYNTIRFVPGTQFELTAYDTEVYIPKGVTFNFELKTKPGYEYKSLGTSTNDANTTITVNTTSTDYNGISTVAGTITSTKNNGDSVVVTPTATEINKVVFGKPVLSLNLSVEEENSGTVTPSAGDFIYQVTGNSCSVKFETSVDYTYEGFAVGSTRFVDVSNTTNNTALYVLSTGTLAQAKAKAPNAKILIHDIVETEFEDNLGQIKKKMSGTISVVIPGETVTVRPVVTPKPSMNISFAEGTPNGINFSLGLNTITSGSVNSKSIKLTTGKTYTATVNVPKGYSFEGWKLVRETSDNRLNWITESTRTTTEIAENTDISFDVAASAEKPADYIRLFNAKYVFELEGRNAGTTKATVDISFKKELKDFNLYLIPVIKAVPEISFAAVNSDYGTLTPASSDVRNLYPGTKIDLNFKSTKLATAVSEIWRIQKWNAAASAYSVDYSANVGYTSLDLTAALKDPVLSSKEIIIYSNDNEVEVQPNSKGEYITTKNAVLYVNKMPEANLRLFVTPEVYNTIRFVPGTQFESSAYDSAVIIPAGKTFDFTIRTKTGNKFSSIGTPAYGSNTDVIVKSQTTSNSGVSTVTGTITSKKNNGDSVVVTPTATEINKVVFGKPVLSNSVNLSAEEENSGTIIPAVSDYIYQLEGNSTSIKFETTGEYTYEGFAVGSTRFVDVSNSTNNTALYVLSTGTLAQAKAKASAAELIIHDLVETDLTDSQGQTKKRVTGTLTVVKTGATVTVKPVTKSKPVFYVNVESEKGSVSPSVAKSILVNEDYNINFISSSGYGFDKWSVTNNDISVPVFTLSEASGVQGASVNLFVLDLGSVQELSGVNSCENIQAVLGSNKSKLLAIVYCTSKVESQAVEGVETATAKFRIVRDTDSTIVVSPATTKHSYFNFSIADSTTGSISPAGRTLIKPNKEYELSLATSKENGFTDWTFTKTGLGTTYEIISDPETNILGKERNYIFRTADPESTKNTAVYKNSIAVIYDEKYEVVDSGIQAGKTTASTKIRFINPPVDYPLDIRPKIFTHPNLTLSDPANVLQKVTLESNSSLTGSVSMNVISKLSGIEKYYDISVIPQELTGVYSQEYYSASGENSWKVYNQSGTLLTGADVYFTTQPVNSLTSVELEKANAAKVVISECNLEYYTETIFKAVAKVRINDDGSYTIKPNTFTQKYLTINAPNYERLGTEHGKVTPPRQNMLFTAYKPVEYYIEMERDFSFKGMKITSDLTPYKNFTVKDVNGVDITDVFDATADNTNPGILFTKTIHNDNSISGTINIINPKNTGNMVITPFVYNEKEPPIMGNVELSSYFVTYKKTYKSYGNSYDATDDKIYFSDKTTSNTALSIESHNWNSNINRSFDVDQTTGYSNGRYIIPREKLMPELVYKDKDGAYDQSSDCQMSLTITGNSDSEEFIIKERLFYLPENLVLNKTGDLDNSDCELIGEGGLQLFDENGNFIADQKYKDAPFIKEFETVILVSDIVEDEFISDTDSDDNTVTFTIGLNLEIPIGGVHQISVYEKDKNGAISDEPKTFYVEMERYFWGDSARNYYENGLSRFEGTKRGVNNLLRSTTIAEYSTYVMLKNLPLVPEVDVRNVLIKLNNAEVEKNGYNRRIISEKDVVKYEHIRSGDEVPVALVNDKTDANLLHYRLSGLKRESQYVCTLCYFDDFGYSSIGVSYNTKSTQNTDSKKQWGVVTSKTSTGELIVKKSKGLVFKDVYEYLDNPTMGEPVAIVIKSNAPAEDGTHTDGESFWETVIPVGENIIGISLWDSEPMKWSTVTEIDSSIIDYDFVRYSTLYGAVAHYGKDYNGKDNFSKIKAALENNGISFDRETFPALHFARNYGTQQFKYKYASLVDGWYLPSYYDIYNLYWEVRGSNEAQIINETLKLLDADPLSDDGGEYWTSSFHKKLDTTTYSPDTIGISIFNSGYVEISAYDDLKKVRPVFDFGTSMVLVED